MSAPTGRASPFPVTAFPTETFDDPRKYMYLNGEGIEILHQPAAHTDGYVVVFFRRSDVLVAGDTLWVCGEYGMLAVSRDAGETWGKLATGTNGCLFGLALGPDGAVWTCGDGGYLAR